MNEINKKIIAVVLIILVMLGAGYFLACNSKNVSQDKNIVLLSPAKDLFNISLTDQNNNEFKKKNLKGKWSLIFFGYTSCPDICPTTLHTLTSSYEQLIAEDFAPLPQILFISVDPDRDKYKGNPKKLKNYIAFFHKDFIAATGNHNQLKLLTSQLGAAYGIKKSSATKKYSKDNYEVAHTPLIFIINPLGQYRGFIRPPHTPDMITELIEELAKNG